jgi:hypothetical protein
MAMRALWAVRETPALADLVVVVEQEGQHPSFP